MCKPVAEGGQRCAAYTRERVRAAAARLDELQKSDGSVEKVAAATRRWEEALTEYASTPKGHFWLIAEAEAAERAGDANREVVLKGVLRAGNAVRTANREAGALMKGLPPEPDFSALEAPVMDFRVEQADLVGAVEEPEVAAGLCEHVNGLFTKMVGASGHDDATLVDLQHRDTGYTHTVARVNGFAVDWTARQLRADAKIPEITPWGQVCERMDARV